MAQEVSYYDMDGLEFKAQPMLGYCAVMATRDLNPIHDKIMQAFQIDGLVMTAAEEAAIKRGWTPTVSGLELEFKSPMFFKNNMQVKLNSLVGQPNKRNVKVYSGVSLVADGTVTMGDLVSADRIPTYKVIGISHSLGTETPLFSDPEGEYEGVERHGHDGELFRLAIGARGPDETYSRIPAAFVASQATHNAEQVLDAEGDVRVLDGQLIFAEKELKVVYKKHNIQVYSSIADLDYGNSINSITGEVKKKDLSRAKTKLYVLTIPCAIYDAHGNLLCTVSQEIVVGNRLKS